LADLPDYSDRSESRAGSSWWAGIICSLPLGMLQARNGAFLSKQQKKQRKKSPLMLQRTYPRNPVNPIHPDETPSR
jgi:hypothetical protein